MPDISSTVIDDFKSQAIGDSCDSDNKDCSNPIDFALSAILRHDALSKSNGKDKAGV